MFILDFNAIINSIPVLIAKDPRLQNAMNSVFYPSFSDILAINRRYGCNCSNTMVCQHGGYINPSNCNKCNCPEGFGGDDCSQPQPSNGDSSCGGIISVLFMV